MAGQPNQMKVLGNPAGLVLSPYKSESDNSLIT